MDAGPESLTVMVQRDVAERFARRPARRVRQPLGRRAVRDARELAFTLRAASVLPAAESASSVVQTDRRETAGGPPRDLALFWKVVRAAFAYRRKTLVNTLALALDFARARRSGGGGQQSLSGAPW